MRETNNLEKDIKNLARTIGLKYENEDSDDEIILAIAEELEAQIDDAEGNPQELSTLMMYLHKLNSLDERLRELNEVENAVEDFAGFDVQSFVRA